MNRRGIHALRVAGWGVSVLLVLEFGWGVSRALSAPDSSTTAPARRDRSWTLSFEQPGAERSLSAWGRFPPGTEGTRFLDSTIVHEGLASPSTEP